MAFDFFSFHRNEAPGATTSRRGNDFPEAKGDANALLRADLGALRDRSRALATSNAYGTKALELLTNHLVGRGIMGVPMLNGIPDEAAGALWEDWANDPSECDYNGQLPFGGLQRLITRCMVEAGECLILRVNAPGNRTVPLRLHVVEPDFIDSNRRVADQTSETVDRVGVRVSRGRPTGYWLYRRHPGDILGTTAQSTLHSADNVIHAYRKDRAGQVRGFPWCTPILLNLKDFHDMLDSEQLRQKMATAYVAFITDINGDRADKVEDIGEIEAGSVEVLPPGRDVKLSSPPQAPNFESFTTVMLRQIAAGYSVSYEGLTGDYSRVNFSSARMAANDFELTIQGWRASAIYPWLNRIWGWWASAASQDATVTWTPPHRRLVDPQKEVDALVKQIRAGLMSWPDAVRSFGGNPTALLQEVANVNAQFDELGLIFDSDGRFSPQTGVRVDPEPPELEEGNEIDANQP